MWLINTKRYPRELYGLLPQQVLNGEIPDRNKFKESIKAQQKVRYQKINRQNIVMCIFLHKKPDRIF